MKVPLSFAGLRRLALCALLVPVVPFNAIATPSATASRQNQANGFDVLKGRWTVHNRKLAKLFAGSTTWINFEALDEFHPLPGGIGMQEHYQTSYWKNYHATGLHIYDRQQQRWTLYWVDNYNLPITLQPPLFGTFSGNVGTFVGPDRLGNKPILVRHIWKALSVNHVTWEQAFSVNHGASWETNWTMDFIRQ